MTEDKDIAGMTFHEILPDGQLQPLLQVPRKEGESVRECKCRALAQVIGIFMRRDQERKANGGK